MFENDDLLKKVVEEISKNHHQIIDDWCKAYLAQLYQENGSIRPGDFTLVEQDGKFCKRYWFEKRSHENERLEKI